MVSMRAINITLALFALAPFTPCAATGQTADSVVTRFDTTGATHLSGDEYRVTFRSRRPSGPLRVTDMAVRPAPPAWEVVVTTRLDCHRRATWAAGSIASYVDSTGRELRHDSVSRIMATPPAWYIPPPTSALGQAIVEACAYLQHR